MDEFWLLMKRIVYTDARSPTAAAVAAAAHAAEAAAPSDEFYCYSTLSHTTFTDCHFHPLNKQY